MSQDEAEGKVCQPEVPVRTERHLARSLEDVSYLFLSEGAAEAASSDEPRVNSPGQAPSQPGERPLFIMADRSPALQREPLISLLNSNTGVLEEGLKAIDVNVPLDMGGSIDLVAVDQSSKLVVIDLDISAGDELLLRGICHFDWFARNVPLLRRMYRGRVIDFSAQPRVFLIAPQFSPMLRCAAQRIACPRISCYLCQIVGASNGAGSLFTRILPP
jgi:hypothetical protein